MIFFGTSSITVHVLNKLLELGIKPEALVTVPDRPAGRKMIMTPPVAKVWALEHNIPIFQFEKLDTEAVTTLSALDPSWLDLFIVASYGKIIPQAVLDIPQHGALNVHPSLLPLLRGATPMQTSILEDMRYTGVTIIKMDKEMDHGPIVAQWADNITPWPQPLYEFEKLMADKGADILAAALPSYIDGTLELIEQDHSKATFTKKIVKEDGLISLDQLTGDSGWKTFLKYNAVAGWPGIYFFIEHMHNGAPVNMRVKVKEASWDEVSATMILNRVVPEGKNEMSWKEFENYLKS